MSSIYITNDSSIEFVDIRAGSPAEFVERLLREWSTDIHEEADTNINVVYKDEETMDKTLYVVRVETDVPE